METMGFASRAGSSKTGTRTKLGVYLTSLALCLLSNATDLAADVCEEGEAGGRGREGADGDNETETPFYSLSLKPVLSY